MNAARRSRRRAGFTLVELMVGAVAAGLAATAALSLLAAHARLLRAHGAARDAAEVMRVASLLLPAEVRLASPTDLAPSTDTLGLRAVRGVGLVCAVAADEVHVRYRGLRLPAPDKDSVLVLPTQGYEEAAALGGDRAAPGACDTAPGEEARTWSLSAASPAVGDIALVFERGSYHLAGGALRYRRGAGGRQPLTETFLAEGSFAFDSAGGVLTVWLRVAPRPARPSTAAAQVRVRSLLWNR
ncbi:MAG TPA: prepilin-type N-terminal cleavage/methylation domain-containing protein [Longimicrobiales bacterium]|nr:prepilin-type N-terminal cleavage/methylation domain-containing protein [Longimicrobiales bacterium]